MFRPTDTSIRRFLRPAVVLAALIFVVLAISGPSWSASTSAPVITLLTPPNGATVYSSVTTTTYPTFTWKVNWDAPENTTVIWESAADPAFTQNVTQENQACPASNVNCFTSFQPRKVWGPPYGSVWYWRVGLTTSAGIVYSQPFQFIAKNPPKVPDRKKPRVKVYPGSAKRGQHAFIRARIGDNSGMVRLRVWLSYKGMVLFRGAFGWTQVSYSITQTFVTKQAVPRYLPRGKYLACVKAWDKAGNHAVNCARYRIR